jgi:hypothetical protein
MCIIDVGTEFFFCFCHKITNITFVIAVNSFKMHHQFLTRLTLEPTIVNVTWIHGQMRMALVVFKGNLA